MQRYGWLTAGAFGVALAAAVLLSPPSAHAEPGTGDSATAARTTPRPAATRTARARAAASVRSSTTSNPLPPRIQWNANDGYCGETSFVSAGLYYGQYISQYDARALASNNMRQNSPASQLLLGVNDVAAAKAMHLSATPFNTARQTTTASFLTWVKSNVQAGFPVLIGVFTNEFRFYGTTNPTAGDPEYDHIVTVTGSASTRTGDVITFNDNGLWTGGNGLPQNTFTVPAGSFATTRRGANARSAPVYSLSNGKDYGIAITGVIDLSHETVPVRLTTSVNAEIPAMADGSTTRPAATPVTLTITVSGLKAGSTYTLYRYSSMAAVPDANINANAGRAAQQWTITATGNTYVASQTIMSNEVAVYRAVPVGAP